jgi:hypothetical protein
MSYLIYGYTFVGVCYATAVWINVSTDPENKELIEDLKKEGAFLKGIVVLGYAIYVLTWPFPLLTKIFGLLFRK